MRVLFAFVRPSHCGWPRIGELLGAGEGDVGRAGAVDIGDLKLNQIQVCLQTKINIVETILTGIALSFLLMTFLAIPIDIISFYGDKETYAKVHNLNMNKEYLEWEYLSRWLYVLGVIIIGLTITTLRLTKRKNKTIQKIYWGFLGLFFGSIVYGYYNWMRTGFDH